MASNSILNIKVNNKWVDVPCLKGEPGKKGTDGMDGSPGADGKSAYDIAVDNGFAGTEAEWLESLKGASGKDGDTYVSTQIDTNYNVLEVNDLSETTKNGVTYSIVDGIISLNGTATASLDFSLGAVLPDGEYVISCEVLSGSWIGNLQYTNNVLYRPLWTNKSSSFTASSGTRSKLSIGSGASFDNLSIHLWANEGSEVYPYQKYGEETIHLVLDDDVEIERLDEHLSNSDIHVTKEEKDAWNSMVKSDALFDDEINDTVTKVLDHNADKALNFAILTDSHVYPDYDDNDSSVEQYKSTINHIKRLNSRIPLDGIIHLGDFTNTQWAWKQENTGELTDKIYQDKNAEYANMLKESGVDNIYIAMGNHDSGVNVDTGSSDSTEYCSYEIVYRNLMSSVDARQRNKVVRGYYSDGIIAPYYYIDIDDMKIRLIFLATDIHSETAENKGIHYNQVLWLTKVLGDIPDDYNVLMFGHISFSMFKTAMGKSYAMTEYVYDIITAFNNHTTYTFSSKEYDYTSKTGKILAYFCGHYHGDRIIEPTNDKAVLSIPEVVIASSGYLTAGVITTGDYYDSSDAPSRTLGTITEDLFDILTYSPSDNKIYLTRFGAGNDREINLIGGVTDSDTIIVPQTGTWQLKNTTSKKYITISTDDDNTGNASFFRLLRTYGFPYTMNVEAENVDKNIGTDDNGTFTDSDAESLFQNDITVKELGKYLIESGLGEVTQHGASSYNLWDSNNLTGTFLDNLYESYTSQGGTRTKDELVAEIKLQLAASDVSQGATYVEESRATIENAIGHPIYALQTWGGSPIATVDGIECNLNSIKGGEYDYRGHNYVFASPRVGQTYKASHSLYEKTRNYHTVDIQTEIDKIAIGDIEDFFAHMPYNDLGDQALRQMLDTVKVNVDAGIVEVITPTQYYNLGEWVDNPIISLSLTRNGNLNIGDTDIDEAYVVTVTYADGTSGSPESDVIIERNSVNTSESGVYEVKAYYRGFTAVTNVFVIDSNFILPDSLKSTDYWFVYSNDTNGNYYCGNATNITEAYISGSGTLAFKGPGTINGWKSTDEGQAWVQVTTNRVCYGNAPTNINYDGDGGYAFDDAWGNKHTFILTSGNFEITYGS